MAKKAKDIEDLISNIEKEIQAEDAVNGNGDTKLLTLTEEETQEHNAHSLMDNIPPDQGFYYKIYRKHPIPTELKGRPLFLQQITQPDLVKDLETEILNMGIQYGWVSGIYEVRLYQANRPGVVKTNIIPLEIPKEIHVPVGTPSKTLDPMESMRNAVSMIKDLNGAMSTTSTPPQTNMVDIMKVVAEMYKANAAPTPPPQDNAATLIALVSALKELAPQSAPSGSSLLTVLKEAGAFRQPIAPTPPPQTDPFDMMMKLKELMPQQQDSLAKGIETLTTLMPLMSQMNGGGGGENSSTMVEVLKILGPQLKDVVSDVTGTINNAIRSKAQIPPQGTRKPKREKRPEENPVTIPEERQIPVENNLPVLQTVERASRDHDESFYPQLEELLGGITTEEQFNDLVSGTLSPKTVLTQISTIGGMYFNSPEAENYFNSFLAWMKNKKNDEILGVCSGCKVELVYENKVEFEMDTKCPDCKEPVVLMGVNTNIIALPDESVAENLISTEGGNENEKGNEDN